MPKEEPCRNRRRTLPSSSNNMAGRSGSPARATRSTSGIWCSTTSSIPPELGPRERFEALARSVRDVLSQRWLRTEQTYDRENPKRVYYLSMEFLIGRSLANNVLNLLLDPVVAVDRRGSEGSTGRPFSRRSPTPAWATAASAGSPPAFSTRWPRCSSRRSATACATSTASSARRSRTAGSSSSPTTGCASPIPGRSRGRSETVEIKLGCSFERARRHPARGPRAGRRTCSASPTIARSSATAARPSTRCGCGPRRRRISSTSRRSAPATSSAPSPRRLAAESLTRVLYPDDSTTMGRGLRFVQEYFLVACSLADLVRALPPPQRRLEHAARQGRHPAQRHPSRRWPSPS